MECLNIIEDEVSNQNLKFPFENKVHDIYIVKWNILVAIQKINWISDSSGERN